MKKLFSSLQKLSEWAFRPPSFIGRLPRFAVLLFVFYIFIVGFMAMGIMLLNVPYLTLVAVSALVSLQLYSIGRNFLSVPRSKKVLSGPVLSCYILGFIGVSLFIVIFTPYTISKHVFHNKKVPLGDLDGIALSEDKYLHVSIPIYKRIQKYDMTGAFITSWPVESAGGKYDLWVDSQNNINVAVSRTSMHIVYNSNGDIIDKKEVPELSEWKKLIENVDPYFAQDNNGDRYVLKKSKWSPKVVKVNPTGKEEVLIKDPMYLFANRAPFPALLYVLMSIIFLFITRILEI